MACVLLLTVGLAGCGDSSRLLIGSSLSTPLPGTYDDELYGMPWYAGSIAIRARISRAQSIAAGTTCWA